MRITLHCRVENQSRPNEVESQMSEIRIHDLRVTSLWVEFLPELMDQTLPLAAPLGGLMDKRLYEDAFDRAQAGNHELDLQPPWRTYSGQHVWMFYLGRDRLDTLRGAEAYRLAVPLRAKAPVRAEAPWLEGYVDVELYYYPFAVAVAITGVSRAELDLDGAAAVAQEITRAGRFEVWGLGPGDEPDQLSQVALARQVREIARREAFRSTAGGKSLAEPFTVVTAVRAACSDPKAPAVEGGAVHRFLHSVTHWPTAGKEATLGALRDSVLDVRLPSSGDLLYAAPRGRAVWFPSLFVGDDPKRHSLSCYHRNLLFAAMQTEALLAVSRDAVAKLEIARKLTGKRLEASRQAALTLGRLYSGVGSYGSWSVRAHIDASGEVPAINRLRDYHGPKLGKLRGREQS